MEKQTEIDLQMREAVLEVKIFLIENVGPWLDWAKEQFKTVLRLLSYVPRIGRVADRALKRMEEAEKKKAEDEVPVLIDSWLSAGKTLRPIGVTPDPTQLARDQTVNGPVGGWGAGDFSGPGAGRAAGGDF
jgi:hypothetical protein